MKYYVVKVYGYAGDAVYQVYANSKKSAMKAGRENYENQFYMGSQSVYSVEVL